MVGNLKHLPRQITDQKWGIPKNLDDVEHGRYNLGAGIEGLEASLTKAPTTTQRGLSEVSSTPEKTKSIVS